MLLGGAGCPGGIIAFLPPLCFMFFSFRLFYIYIFVYLFIYGSFEDNCSYSVCQLTKPINKPTRRGIMLLLRRWCFRPHLIKKFVVFFGARWFITVFTTARTWPLPWARLVQGAPTFLWLLRPILYFSPHLRLRLLSCLLPWGIPSKTFHVDDDHDHDHGDDDEDGKDDDD